MYKHCSGLLAPLDFGPISAMLPHLAQLLVCVSALLSLNRVKSSHFVGKLANDYKGTHQNLRKFG